MAETVHGKVVLRETRVDIAESASLGRATRCVADKTGHGRYSLGGRTGVSLGYREEDHSVLLGKVSYVDIFTLLVL